MTGVFINILTARVKSTCHSRDQTTGHGASVAKVVVAETVAKNNKTYSIFSFKLRPDQTLTPLSMNSIIARCLCLLDV